MIISDRSLSLSRKIVAYSQKHVLHFEAYPFLSLENSVNSFSSLHFLQTLVICLDNHTHAGRTADEEWAGWQLQEAQQ